MRDFRTPTRPGSFSIFSFLFFFSHNLTVYYIPRLSHQQLGLYLDLQRRADCRTKQVMSVGYLCRAGQYMRYYQSSVHHFETLFI
ncbi:hypothetical protein BDQ94DRAFT_154696, partial [Aspergillus welwitschiae]